MNTADNVAIAPDLPGYFAAPGTAAAPGVVVLMEAFGLTAHVRGVCDRLAAAGFAALAPDFLRGKIIAYDDVESLLGTLRALRDDTAMQDVSASLDFLSRQPQVDGKRLGIAGLCMGGRLAFLANCRFASRLKAAVAFYGGGIAPPAADRFGRVPPIGEAEAMQAPLLLIYGGRDAAIGIDEHARLAQRLGTLGKPYSLSVYPGAEHGFCCEDRDSYRADAAAAAYAEAIDFLRRHLAG
jgi:carboxymethylenebutenolidase